MASPADLGKLQLCDFEPHLNAVFEMDLPDGKVPLRLHEVTAHKHKLPETVTTDEGKEHKIRDGGGFTLQFIAPESSRLGQGIYPINHPKLGTMEIFLVPNGPAHDGHGFHAVFG